MLCRYNEYDVYNARSFVPMYKFSQSESYLVATKIVMTNKELYRNVHSYLAYALYVLILIVKHF